jgi:hypothetical protein
MKANALGNEKNCDFHDEFPRVETFPHQPTNNSNSSFQHTVFFLDEAVVPPPHDEEETLLSLGMWLFRHLQK